MTTKEFLTKLLKIENFGDYGEGCCCTKQHTFLWDELEMSPEDFEDKCKLIVKEFENEKQ